MSIDRKVGKCVVCGEKFARQRISKTTCSDRCRKALSRKNQAISLTVATQLFNARQSITEIKRLMQIGEHSYEAAKALEIIATEIHIALPKRDNMWHCENCKKIIRATVPMSHQCKCQTPKWVLQKKML